MKLGHMKPNAKNVSKLENARILLAIHGFISDAENAKVRRRIDKWFRSSDPGATRKPLLVRRGRT